MDLKAYHWIVINSSSGKDSQAMTDFVVALAREQKMLDRVVMVHADLGKEEWSGSRELAQEHAKHYGIRFYVVKRKENDLLDHVRERGMWPSSDARYCTSDHKRGPVGTLFTKLAKEWLSDTLWARNSGQSPAQCRILNCMGMRAEESPARSKLPIFKNDARNTNGRKHVDIWLPIFTWTVGQVWERIKASGVRWHRAYDLGMPRLSCCFCIFAPENALLLAGKHNPELLDAYVAVEKEIGHDFKHGFKIATIKEKLAAGIQPGPIKTWNM